MVQQIPHNNLITHNMVVFWLTDTNMRPLTTGKYLIKPLETNL
jgi:hypothetical protein